jgi:hypothetical protein
LHGNHIEVFRFGAVSIYIPISIKTQSDLPSPAVSSAGVR